MKTYAKVDLTGNTYINPVGTPYGDGTGTHQRAVSQITSIAVHHNASQRIHDYDSVAQYMSEAAYHYSHLGPGLQYHVTIDNTGTIFYTRPFTTWLYAVGSAENVTTINVCLDGNMENQQPTREQLEALYQLLEELCERHPEFPATWPNVRPHQSYTATACCGANLRDRIYAIQDKASAQAQLLNQGEFDWPSLQPAAVIPPPPVPVDTRPEWEKNFVALDTVKYSVGTATVVDMTTGATLSTVADNVKLEIGGKTSFAGTEMFISKYWTSRNVHSKGIPGGMLKDTPKPVTPPPTPTAPPPPEVQNDHTVIVDTNQKVNAILGLVQKIWAAFKKIFNIGE